MKAQNTIPISIDGKIQPQSIELEEAILGAMLLESNCIQDVLNVIRKPETFYKPANQSVFRAILNLIEKKQPVDLLTVTAQLKKNDEIDIAGGAYYISQLTNRVASTSSVEHHAYIVLEKYLSRELIRENLKSIENTYSESVDINDELTSHEKNVAAISNNISTFTVKTIGEVNKEAISILEMRRNGEIDAGIYIGFKKLYEKLGGWHKSDLIILAARPAMGKTGLAVKFLLDPAIEKNIPTAFFSLEMKDTSIVTRIQADLADMDSNYLITQKPTNNDINRVHTATQCLNNAPVYIDHTAALSIPDFRIRAKKLVKNYGVKLIIIDYLQLMRSGQKGLIKEQEVSTISAALKQTARELDVPIIALSQLSRECERRIGHGKRPQLADLRDTGAIEQDADVVVFIYRPEYYGLESFEDNSPSRGIAELYIAKNRQGEVCKTNTGFIGSRVRFYDLDKDSFKPEPLQPNTSFETGIDIVR